MSNYLDFRALQPIAVLTVHLVVGWALPSFAHAQGSAGRDTLASPVVVIPSARYGAGWFHTVFLGRRYRDLWATPVTVEVLDLDSFGGGLTPFKRGGFGQSVNLHFRGADGRRYVFRSLDKELRLAEDLRGTLVEEEFQDMKVSAFHPWAAMIVAPLLEAAGVLHAEPRMVVLPDDPRLGEFRREYANLLGMIEERPNEGRDDAPGFAGSQKVVGTDVLFKRLEESPVHRVDAREYLKARLLDVWFGDRDRHAGQWRWARFEKDGRYAWRPIPRDRDEAFVANDGLIWQTVRIFWPRFASFQDEYPGIRGLTENGWEMDEVILPALERSTWDEVAAELQTVLSDSVIAAAVHRMPAAMYRSNGAALERALRLRRDHLQEKAAEYYELFSRQVDIRATDWPELAVVEPVENGLLEVRLYARDRQKGTAVPIPYYRRRFDPRETSEIRIHLQGGDDRALVRGSGKVNILVRVIGGGGDDEFIDSSDVGGLDVRFYDHRGDNTFVTGSGTSVDTRSYERAPSPDPIRTFLIDWGFASQPTFVLGSNADHGILVGGGFVRYRYGFRKAPYQNRLSVRGGVTTSGRVLFEVESDYPEVAPGLSATLHASVNGVSRVRFHGFGNETIRADGSDIFRIDQYRYVVDPTLSVAPWSKVRMFLGPVFKVTDSDTEPNRLLDLSTYGAGVFSQLGARAGIKADFRDRSGWTKRGVRFDVGGGIFPAVLDVNDLFGEVHGEIATYLSAPIPTEPTLTLRVGGKKVWGDVPFHEAAYLGGGGTLRGFDQQRFAGDAALHGNAELRFALTRVTLLNLPTDIGVFALADAGRVYVNGDSPGGWHTAGGGGIWFAPLRRDFMVTAALAHSAEQNSLYVRTGFAW